jgi:hypothetical protein
VEGIHDPAAGALVVSMGDFLAAALEVQRVA